MKKSELRQLIREEIKNKMITEGLIQKFKDYIKRRKNDEAWNIIGQLITIGYDAEEAGEVPNGTIHNMTVGELFKRFGPEYDPVGAFGFNKLTRIKNKLKKGNYKLSKDLEKLRLFN